MKKILLLAAMLLPGLSAAPTFYGPPYNVGVYGGQQAYLITIKLDPGYSCVDPYTYGSVLPPYDGYAVLYTPTTVTVYSDGANPRNGNYCQVGVEAPQGSGSKLLTFEVFEEAADGPNPNSDPATLMESVTF